MRIDTFRNYLLTEKRYSEKTARAYLTDIRQFQSYVDDYFQGLTPSDITHQHIRSWMVYMMDQGTSARSVGRKLSSLRSWYRHLKKRGEVTGNPFAKVQAPRAGKQLPEVISREAMWKLLKGMEYPADFSGARDKIVMVLLYALGLRRGELLELKIEDLDFSRGIVQVHGKGGKVRHVPLSPSVQDELNSYLLVREDHLNDHTEINHLILTDRGKHAYPKLVYNIVRRHLPAVATNARISPHVLRHSFATHLSDSGADINAIKELLGHSSLAATQVYTHSSIKRLQEVYRQAHPKGKE